MHETATLSEGPVKASPVTLPQLAGELLAQLRSIEAIAYYVEMTLRTDQLDARQQLIRVQQLTTIAQGILSDVMGAEAKTTAS